MKEALQSIMDSYTSFSKGVTWLSVLVYAAIFAVSWIVYRLMLKPKFSPLRKIPGRPSGSIIFGNMREIFSGESTAPFVNVSITVLDNAKTLIQWIQSKECQKEVTGKKWVKEMKTGLIRYSHLLQEQRILVADADAIKHITVLHSKNYTKPAFLFRIFQSVTGKGLLSLNGEEHLTQRKLCLGAFKTSFLKNMLPAMQRHGEELADLWIEQIKENNEKELDISGDLLRTALDVISECGFGYTTSALLKPEQKETQAITYMLSSFSRPSLLRLLLPTVAAKIPSQENRKTREKMQTADTLVNSVISSKKKVLEKMQDDSKLTDLLSMLLLARDTQTGESLSQQQLRDHVMTFMLAGHETSASSLTWGLLLLAQHQDIQKRLRDEVTAILPPRGQPVTSEHVENMTYLNCVIKEIMRLYPVAPNTFRTALRDDMINGYQIPAGTVLNIQVGVLHRNPDYWEDAEEFQPDRFMDETKINPYAFLPFMAGPRMCIGYKFALFEMKVVLAVLVRELNFWLADPNQVYKRRQRITMKPDPVLKLKADIINV